MFTTPAIFKTEAKFTPETDIAVRNNSHWVEFVLHASQFTQLAVPDTRSKLNELLKSEADPANRAVLLTGIGRCMIHGGEFLKGARTLGHAFSMLHEDNREAKAFILLEMASFLAIIGNYNMSLVLLEKIPDLTRMEYLLRITNYYTIVNKARGGDPSVLEDLYESAKYFESIQQHSILAYHHKNIANTYRKQGNYRQAEYFYSKAINLAEKHNYSHIKCSVIHDRGMLEYYKGNFQNAVRILEEAVSIADNIFTASFATGNIGYLYYHNKDFDTAGSYLQKTLNLSIAHGYHHLIPGVCYYLGKCAEHNENRELALFYFEKGYQAAFELVRNHFTLAGDRERVMKAYIMILNHNQFRPSREEEPDDMAFAKDKTLREIRDLFQNTILKVVLSRTGSIDGTLENLQIAQRTYYTIRARTAACAGEKSPHAMIKFINENDGLNWKDLNQAYENLILAYLYEEYGRNKKRLSTKLGLSYSRTLRITQGIESKIQLDNGKLPVGKGGLK